MAVTNAPDFSMEIAKRRLEHFDMVVPVERLTDAHKYLSYIARRPLPGQIENVRTLTTACSPFITSYNLFVDEVDIAVEEGAQKQVDCNGKAWACYTAKSLAQRKRNASHEVLAARGHSLEVTRYIREMNSLDQELHEFSVQLWDDQWSALLETEGEPECEIVCDGGKFEAACKESVKQIETQFNISFLSDDFHSIQENQMVFMCPPSSHQCWDDKEHE